MQGWKAMTVLMAQSRAVLFKSLHDLSTMATLRRLALALRVAPSTGTAPAPIPAAKPQQARDARRCPCSQPQPLLQRDVPGHPPTRPGVHPAVAAPLASQLPGVAVDIVLFVGFPPAVAADTGEAVAVSIAAGSGERDGVPARKGHGGCSAPRPPTVRGARPAARATHLPHGLVGQPARVAVVVAILEGGLEVLGRGDDGRVVQAGTPGSGEGQCIALARGAVVEDNAWKGSGWQSWHGVLGSHGL